MSHFNDHYTKGWTNDFLEGKDYALKVAWKLIKAKYGRADAKGKRQIELSSRGTLFGSSYC